MADWQSVNSTNLSQIKYDELTHTMDVKFKNGAQYRYKDVPQEEFDGLMSADSPGGYLRSQIIGVYRHDRIG